MVEQSSVGQFLESIVKDEGDRIRPLAQCFYNSARSGGFKWLGLGRLEDELKAPHLVIYLAENPQSDQETDDISEPFTELSLALRPQLYLDLYYIPPDTDKPLQELVIEDMNHRYASVNYHPNAKLIYEESLLL